MATVQGLTKEERSGSRSTSPHLERTRRQTASLLDAQLQRFVERAAALVDAPRVSLAVLDPASQALEIVTIWSKRFGGAHSANRRVHKEMARWVPTHREPALIADFAGDPRVRALGMRAVGSWMSVPLLAGQEAIGALTIASPEINAFRLHHLQQLEVLAELSALAIFQARQLDVAAQQTRHLTTLLEVSRGLATTSDARTIIRHTVSGLRRLIPCEEAVILRSQVDTATLWGVAGLGTQSRRLAEACIPVSDPQSVTAWVAQHRRPLLYQSGAQGFLGLTTESLLFQREMALLAVPLFASERLWGVILLARPVPFATDDLRTMLTLSQILAPALAQERCKNA